MGRKSLLGRIKLLPTEEPLTACSGLGPMIEAFHASKISKGFYDALPKREHARSLGKRRLGLIFLSSFLYGHDSVDDLEEFRKDEFLENFYRDKLPAPRTMIDFLNDFDDKHIKKLNEFLAIMSHAVRKSFINNLPTEHKPGPIHLSIDSTPHEQSGLKMEGVAMNYDGKWCLDSQRISDQNGLTYGFQLRAGNTGKGVGAKELIQNAFKGMSFNEEKYLSGDSAYIGQDVIRTCLSLGVKFTVTASDTIKWKAKLAELDKEGRLEWEPSKNSSKIDYASFYWRPTWDKNNQLQFPVVVKRTWVEFKDDVKKEETGNLFDYNKNKDGRWEYYAVVTNMSLFKHKKEEVILHHNKRGNCERFIKEEKYGFDLLHFPCLKLKKNFAFGLMAQVAHNILRWLAVMERPDRPHFSKKLRHRFLYIPGKLVKHARQVYLKIPKRFYEEVKVMQAALQLSQPRAALDTG